MTLLLNITLWTLSVLFAVLFTDSPAPAAPILAASLHGLFAVEGLHKDVRRLRTALRRFRLWLRFDVYRRTRRNLRFAGLRFRLRQTHRRLRFRYAVNTLRFWAYRLRLRIKASQKPKPPRKAEVVQVDNFDALESTFGFAGTTEPALTNPKPEPVMTNPLTFTVDGLTYEAVQLENTGVFRIQTQTGFIGYVKRTRLDVACLQPPKRLYDYAAFYGLSNAACVEYAPSLEEAVRRLHGFIQANPEPEAEQPEAVDPSACEYADILSLYASALINMDYSAEEFDRIEYARIVEYLAGFEVLDVLDEPHFGTCEATGLQGQVSTYRLRPIES